MIFPLFLICATPALVRGQDPYAILGVGRKATKSEIMKAFRAKAKKYHPDINKQEGAQALWIKINDAYELLNDPKARETYDKFGLVDESMDNAPKRNNQGDIVRQIINREMASRSANPNVGEFDNREKQEIVDEINDANFNFKTNDGRPWVILMYQHSYECNQYNDILSDLFMKTGLLFGIARMNAANSRKTAARFKIKHTPQIVVYDSSNGKSYLYNGEMRLNKIVTFATRRFGAEVTEVKNDDEILVWRKKNLDKIHIILFSDLKKTPTQFLLAGAILKNIGVFAFASIDKETIPNFPRALGSTSMEDLPTYVFYRMANPKDDTFGGPVIPLVAPLDLDAGCLAALVRHFSFPVFSYVNTKNFKRLCPNRCILFADGKDIAEDIKIGANAMNLETGTLNLTEEIGIATKFWLEPGDFLILKPKERKYVVWREVTTWKEFRSNLEFLNKGLANYQTIDYVPNVVSQPPVENVVKESQLNIMMTSLRNSLVDCATKFNKYIKTLSPTTVLIGVGLTLVIVVEMFSICFKTPKKVKNN